MKTLAQIHTALARMISTSTAPSVEPVTTYGWYACTDGTYAKCGVRDGRAVEHVRLVEGADPRTFLALELEAYERRDETPLQSATIIARRGDVGDYLHRWEDDGLDDRTDLGSRGGFSDLDLAELADILARRSSVQRYFPPLTIQADDVGIRIVERAS